MTGEDLAAATEPQQEQDEAPSEPVDPFFQTLTALKQVIQPPSDQLRKQVHILQRENRMLFDKLENLRQESQEQLQTVQQESKERLQRLQQEWEETLQVERTQLQKDNRQLAADLETTKAKLDEAEKEKSLAVDRVEEERGLLEQSMIQLESENAILKQKYETSTALGAKMEAELNERTHAYEQSKVAMAKIRGLLSDAESNAAELDKYKQKVREAQSNASNLQYKLQQTERDLATTKAKLTSMEQEEAKRAVESQSKLEAEQAKAQEEERAKMASFRQQLDEKEKEYGKLQEQLKTEMTEFQGKLSAKDALLEAKDKMIKLVTAKSESLQKKEAELKRELKRAQESTNTETSTQDAETASLLKEQLDEVKDELACAEEEVKRCRKEMASMSEMRSKLEEMERELVTAKSRMASMERETAQFAVAAGSPKLKEVQPDCNTDDASDRIAILQQQLDESKKAYSTLQDKMQVETLNLQGKLSAKDALLEAKEKMLKLVTAKSESLQRRENVLKQELNDAQAAAARAAGDCPSKEVSLKGEMDNRRDELVSAEEELARSQDKLEDEAGEPAASSPTSSRVLSGHMPPETGIIGCVQRKDSSRKRPLQDGNDSIDESNDHKELDSIKANLLAAKTRRNKRAKS